MSLVAGRSPFRPSSTAYAIASTFPPQSEPPTQRHWFPDAALPLFPRRAAPPVYDIAASFVVPSEPPIQRHWFPEKAAAAGRPAVSTYTVLSPSFVIQNEPPTQRHQLPDQARSFRVGVRAFDVASTFVVPDITNEETLPRRILPERADPPRRAGAEAYRVHYYGLTVPEDEPHTIVQLYPVRAPAPPRAAGGSYAIASTFVVESLLAFAGPMLPQRTPAPPRAASYDLVATFPPQAEPPMARHSLPDAASPPRRAALDAYWHGASFVVADVQLPPPTFVAMPDRANRLPLAGGAAYAIAATFVIQAEPATQVRLLSERAPARPRASSDAYAVYVRLALDEPIIGAIFITSQAPGPRRAAATSYDISTTFTDEALSPERPRGFLDLQTRQLRRAAFTAYWIAQLPATFPTTSGAFPGPWYPAAALVVAAGIERGVAWVSGTDAAFAVPEEEDEDNG